MHTITVLGLSNGEKSQMSIGVYDKLVKSENLIAMAVDHPIFKELVAEGFVFDALDYLYVDNTENSDEVVTEIVAKLIEKASIHPITYVVAGHQVGGEDTVQELIKQYEKVEILKDRSFLDDIVRSVNIDPLEGFQLLHVSDLKQDSIQTNQPVFVMQVFNQIKARDVKVTLMRKYPADHKVAFIDDAGSQSEMVSWMLLNEIDSFEGGCVFRTLYSPPLILDEQVTSLSTLQHYIDQVTAPDGDVWINEQTPLSLVQYLKEETSELIEAIEKEDTDNWMEELGDVLVQILYQTNAAEKEGLFTFEDVLENVNRKIRRRHPHVFDGVEANTPEEVDAIWQKIKQEEKRMKDET